MGSKLRTFIAIELPGYIQDDLRKLQHVFISHRFDIRWVKPLNMHLTITFLGDIDPSEIKAVSRTLSETAARYPVFELVPRGVGVFPSIRQARIIWTGVAGQTHVLRQLQASVEKALEPLGFIAERRLFTGHLTMGRIKKRIDPKRLADALRIHQGFASDPFAVERLVLFKSDLKKNGPIYTKLREIRLDIQTES
ncbi:MAG: RNA 2',3'-cyclic phosphodiesterase [Desulfobacterales bacterium]|nr:RNA 2',3'-cyclic phosphodiesterase [Desulfobacterales bacterium]MDX2511011.1 RNA 2',3'-cyclic phosphodiesterase [Desulfobacterales bacterium]